MAFTISAYGAGDFILFSNPTDDYKIDLENPVIELQNGVVLVRNESNELILELEFNDFQLVDNEIGVTIEEWRDLLVGLITRVQARAKTVIGPMPTANNLFDGSYVSGETGTPLDLGAKTTVTIFGTSEQATTIMLQVSHDGVEFFDSNISQVLTGEGNIFFNIVIASRWIRLKTSNESILVVRAQAKF